MGQPEERNEAAIADEDKTIPLSNVIKIHDEQIRGHLGDAERFAVCNSRGAYINKGTAPAPWQT